MQEKTILKGGEYLIRRTAPEAVFCPEDFDDELRMIGQTARDYVANEVIPNLDRLEKLEPGLSEELMRKAGELGLLGIEVPEEYGGMNLSKTAAVVVSEYIAGSSGFNTTLSAHQTIGTLPLAYFGTEEQKKKYLEKLATGEWVSAYALTEPEAGSDALGGRTQAVLSEDGKYYILNGTKMWISNAGFASLFTVFAKIDGDRKKFSAFLIERDTPGLSFGAEEKKMGIKSSSTRQVILQDVKVPVENLLGEVGQGAKIAFNILNSGRFKLGASCVGASKQLLEISTRYAQEREQFRMPISSFGMIREKLAEMAIRTYAVEAATYRTIGMIDEAIGTDKSPRNTLACIEEYAIECSMIKILGSELLDYVVDEAVQVHGGYGYSSDYPVERAYRDARINRIYEGTNEINRLIIPGMLVKRAMKGHLHLLEALEEGNGKTDLSGIDEADNPLARELSLLELMKKVALLVLGSATLKYRESFEREQEILARCADIITLIYAGESACLRTLKHYRSGKNSETAIAMTRAWIYSTAPMAERWAREALAHFLEGDDLQAHLEMVRAYSAAIPAVDVIGLKQQVAAAVLKAGGYPTAVI